MTGVKDHLSVCICTYKRLRFLKRLLEAIDNQETGGLFDFSIVIVDNDSQGTAKDVVAAFVSTSATRATYLLEPAQNIAMARNKAVQAADGNYLAFIDDDEFPEKDWLRLMLQTCKTYNVAGVLGPVKPHFETTPPKWLTRAGFYNRPLHETGFVLGWQEARTGNVLLRAEVLEGMTDIFNPQFGQGGEDQDFFRRAMKRNNIFVWCNEAPVYETVSPHRWERGFLIKRALLRGKMSLRHPRHRLRNIGKSLVAVPLYTLALPFLFVLGQHLFMKYFVRLFDHLGRLLAVFHLNPVQERCH